MSAAPAPRPPVASVPFVRITAANTLFFLCFASFFLLPVWLKELGASESSIGLVMAAGPAASMLMMPIVGTAVDRWGRRLPFLVVGYAGMAVVAWAFSRIDHFDPWALGGLRLLSGLFFGSAFTVANIFVADAVPASRMGQGIGIFGVFILLSHVVAPMVAEPLALRFGFPAVFGGAAVLPLIAIAVLPSERSAPRQARGGAGGLRPLLRHRGFQAVLWLTVAAGAGFAMALTFVPTYAAEHDIRPVSTFFAAYAIAAIAVRLGAGRLSDVEPRVRVIAPASGGFVLALAAVPWIGSWATMAAVGVLFGASHGLMYPTACALALERVDEAERGSAMALYNLGFNVGGTVTLVAGGRLIDAFGYRIGFPAVAAVVAAFAVRFALRERGREELSAG